MEWGPVQFSNGYIRIHLNYIIELVKLAIKNVEFPEFYSHILPLVGLQLWQGKRRDHIYHCKATWTTLTNQQWKRGNAFGILQRKIAFHWACLDQRLKSIFILGSRKWFRNNGQEHCNWWTMQRNFAVRPERWNSKWTEFIWRNTIFHLRSQWGIILSLVAYTVSSHMFHRTFGKARFGIKNKQRYLSQEFDV